MHRKAKNMIKHISSPILTKDTPWSGVTASWPGCLPAQLCSHPQFQQLPSIPPKIALCSSLPNDTGQHWVALRVQIPRESLDRDS